MMAAKHHFYEFCLKGNEEVQKCLGELMGEDGKLTTCAGENRLMQRMSANRKSCYAVPL